MEWGSASSISTESQYVPYKRKIRLKMIETAEYVPLWLRVQRQHNMFAPMLPQPYYSARAQQWRGRIDSDMKYTHNLELQKSETDNEYQVRDIFTKPVCSLKVNKIYGDVAYIKRALGLCMPTEREILQSTDKITLRHEPWTSCSWRRDGKVPSVSTKLSSTAFTKIKPTPSMSIPEKLMKESMQRHNYEIKTMLELLTSRKRQFSNKSKFEERKVDFFLREIDVAVRKCRSFDGYLKEHFYKTTGIVLSEFKKMMTEMMRRKEQLEAKYTGVHGSRKLTFREMIEFLDDQGKIETQKTRRYSTRKPPERMYDALHVNEPIVPIPKQEIVEFTEIPEINYRQIMEFLDEQGEIDEERVREIRKTATTFRAK